MTRKEIQQLILERIHETKGTFDTVEVCGNIGIVYSNDYNFLVIHYIVDSEVIDMCFTSEEIQETFGDILNNSERIRWNKIRKFIKEVC